MVNPESITEEKSLESESLKGGDKMKRNVKEKVLEDLKSQYGEEGLGDYGVETA